MAAVVAVAALSCGGGGEDESLVEPEVRRPPAGGSSSVATTSEPVEEAQDAAASATTSTTVPLGDVGDLDLSAASVRLLCPEGEVTTTLGGEPAGHVFVEVVQDLRHDLDLDGTPERVVLVSCRSIVDDPAGEPPDGTGGPVERSVVALVAGTEGLVQLGDPVPGQEVHDVEAVLVVEHDRVVEGNRSTSYVPLTVVDGRLAPGGPGVALSTADPALPMGLGGLEIGASYPVLAANVGGSVTVQETGSGAECVLVGVDDGPDGIRGLGGEGTLAAVEVTNPEVRTGTGLGIGTSADEVRFTYGDHLERARDPADPAREFLVASPPDTDGLTVVFEITGGKVVGYRVGEPGWASALDGCG